MGFAFVGGVSDVGEVSNFSPEERRDIVLQLLAGRPMAELAREHQLSTTAIYWWRDQFLEAGILHHAALP